VGVPIAEIAEKMTNEFLHPNASSTLLAARRRQRDRRIDAARKFILVKFPHGLRISGLLCIFALPVLGAAIFHRKLSHFDDVAWHLPSLAILIAAGIIGLYGWLLPGLYDNPDALINNPTEYRRLAAKYKQENQWKQKIVVGIAIILFLVGSIMHPGPSE
jgi:hypothetical protein